MRKVAGSNPAWPILSISKDETSSLFDIKRGIRLPKYLTPQLSELIGYHIGDGYCNVIKRKHGVDYRIEYSGNKHDAQEVKYYNSFLKKTFEELFNISPHITIRDNGTIRLLFRSKAIVYFYKSVLGIPLGNKTKTADIPNIIKNSDFKIKLSFLRGLFIADGYTKLKKRGYPTIRLTSASNTLICSVFVMLSDLGFNPTKRLDIVRFDKRTNKSYVTNEICLNGHKNYYLWNKLVGWW